MRRSQKMATREGQVDQRKRRKETGERRVVTRGRANPKKEEEKRSSSSKESINRKRKEKEEKERDWGKENKLPMAP